MISMEPINKHGFAVWDRGLFPGDEFLERTRAVRERMKEAGLSAVVVFGTGYDDAEMNYLSGTYLEGALLLTAEGEPALISSGGSREIYFLKQTTWIDELSSSPNLAAGVKKVLSGRSLSGGAIGLVGTRVLSEAQREALSDALQGFQLHEDDGLVTGLLRQPRPREVMAVETSLAIAQMAAEAGRAVHAAGGSNLDALNEAERVARRLRAFDVRCLVNLEDGNLRPYERPSAFRSDPLQLWVGVRYQNYWAHAVASGAEGAAGAALEAMVAAARTGATAGDVAAAAVAKLPDASAALSYGLGAGIGQQPGGPPAIVPGSSERLLEGELLSLRVVLPGAALAGALVRVGATGAERLAARKLDWSL